MNKAALLREDANQYPHLHHADPAPTLAEADQMETAALAFLHPDRNSASNRQLARRERSPRVAAIAEKQRLVLASEARSDELAIDMAESLEAENSAQVALAHQMSAAHALAMRLAGRANLEIEGLGRHDWQAKREVIVEIARLSNAAARLMDTYQRGLLALAKAQDGEKWPVLVQRVQVNDGGQAVVAGQVRGPENGRSGEKS
jgi:hypothetical protein